jgi:hypothetical protein
MERQNNDEEFEQYCEVCGMFADLYNDDDASYYNKETFIDDHIRYASDCMIRKEFIRRGLSVEDPYQRIMQRLGE